MRKRTGFIPWTTTTNVLAATDVSRMSWFFALASVGAMLVVPGTSEAALFVSNGAGSGGVYEFGATTGQFIKSFGADVLGNPSGLTFDSSGNLLAATIAGANPVVAFHPATGAEIGPLVTGEGGILDRPEGLTIGPDGDLYAANGFVLPVPNSILRYDASTGAFINVFAAPAGTFYSPFDLSFGPNGNLYVTTMQDSAVYELDRSTGAVAAVFGAGLNGGAGLVFGPDGNLYVSSFYTNQVMEYNGTTGAFMGTFASGGGLIYPEGLAFGPDGNLYVASFGSDKVLEYNGQTGAFIGDFASAPGLAGPSFLVFGPSVAAVAERGTIAIWGCAGALLSFVTFARRFSESRRLRSV